MSFEKLKANVEEAKTNLALAEQELEEFLVSPEQNVFSSLDLAEKVLEERLIRWATEDCEGAHNHGSDEYVQEFIFGGDHYLATLECEYNRHAKTYYYLESSDFSIKKAI